MNQRESMLRLDAQLDDPILVTILLRTTMGRLEELVVRDELAQPQTVHIELGEHQHRQVDPQVLEALLVSGGYRCLSPWGQLHGRFDSPGSVTFSCVGERVS